MRDFKITIFGMITVSLDMRIVNVFVLLRFECVSTTLWVLYIFSGNKVSPHPPSPSPKVSVRLN